MTGVIRRKLDRLRSELRRTDLSRLDRVVGISESALKASSLWPWVAVGRRMVYELTAPPAAFRGLRDLAVRRATPDDTDGMAAMFPDDPTEPALIRARFAAGNTAFVGELDGRLLAHVWFHPGPTPFDDDAQIYGSFALDDGAWWAYHAIAVAEARSSGLFIKVFQSALRSLFLDSGATRVLSGVKTTNAVSVAMHERMGFRRVATLEAVLVPGLRWLRRSGEGGARNWVRLRSSPPLVSFPQAARP
jgi:RimJ/RimL family protein N-acetyltransferase